MLSVSLVKTTSFLTFAGLSLPNYEDTQFRNCKVPISFLSPFLHWPCIGNWLFHTNPIFSLTSKDVMAREWYVQNLSLLLWLLGQLLYSLFLSCEKKNLVFEFVKAFCAIVSVEDNGSSLRGANHRSQIAPWKSIWTRIPSASYKHVCVCVCIGHLHYSMCVCVCTQGKNVVYSICIAQSCTFTEKNKWC